MIVGQTRSFQTDLPSVWWAPGMSGMGVTVTVVLKGLMTCELPEVCGTEVPVKV